MKILMNEYIIVLVVIATLILIIMEIIVIRQVKKRLWQKWKRESSRNTVYMPYEKSETAIPSATDYETVYLRPANTVSRNGRSMNIRNEFHAKITSLICIFPEKNISIYGYVDHVLENHFRQHHKEILSLIARKGCRFDIWKFK